MKKREKLTIEYFLGKIVGEYIVSNYLPTLSTDMILSSNVIEVSENDTKEHARLENIWRNSSNFLKKKNEKKTDVEIESWDIHLKNMYYLGGKYLPHELKMRIPKFGFHLISSAQNVEDFKDGIINTLWNCDICSYDISPQNIDIRETEGFAWCDYITLKLDEKYIQESLVNPK